MAAMITAENDERNICGFPPVYTLLKAIEAARAEGLDYGISYGRGDYAILRQLRRCRAY